jgi:hypothetical protein
MKNDKPIRNLYKETRFPAKTGQAQNEEKTELNVSSYSRVCTSVKQKNVNGSK